MRAMSVPTLFAAGWFVAAGTLAAACNEDEHATHDSATSETVADETATDETATDETVAGETVADETVADETVADETVADETVAGDTATDETGEGETVAGDTVSDTDTADSPGKRVELKTNALTLPGVTQVCYAVEITNGLGAQLLRHGTPNDSAGIGGADEDGQDEGDPICSKAFGTGGGDIAYVAPCDASSDAVKAHTITIWLDGVQNATGDWQTDQETDGVADPDFVNPCPFLNGATNWDRGGCTLSFTCQENEDVQVSFSVTTMRDANQGFFDIAVQFEDVFCSGKIETCYDDNGSIAEGGFDDDNADDPIRLLFGDDGVRVWTTVVAFACTGDANATPRLYQTDINITCQDDTGRSLSALLRANATEGNRDFAGDVSGPADALLQSWAIYRGDETLACESGGFRADCKKVHWNTAIAFDDNQAFDSNCTIRVQASASGTGFSDLGASGFGPPANGKYPVLDGVATVTSAAADGAMVCKRLNVGQDQGLDVDHFNLHFTQNNGAAFPGADFCTQVTDGSQAPVRNASCIDDFDPLEP